MRKEGRRKVVARCSREVERASLRNEGGVSRRSSSPVSLEDEVGVVSTVVVVVVPVVVLVVAVFVVVGGQGHGHDGMVEDGDLELAEDEVDGAGAVDVVVLVVVFVVVVVGANWGVVVEFEEEVDVGVGVEGEGELGAKFARFFFVVAGAEGAGEPADFGGGRVWVEDRMHLAARGVAEDDAGPEGGLDVGGDVVGDGEAGQEVARVEVQSQGVGQRDAPPEVGPGLELTDAVLPQHAKGAQLRHLLLVEGFFDAVKAAAVEAFDEDLERRLLVAEAEGRRQALDLS
eukprot:CAMPEP_0118914454 /NCGR_PEP_ID=MMETSP1166-20130328/14825_1 /TAXON_ID=1104430 /ORGANISM="Chrysoreinhardia sp, Strain CCMP3193" /LENGTH=286 /DNA_ID=CAMNT_0006854039 /DNA_START=100 /DNA_END=957 /DNA_ORIENTATION=+